jgi:hypothetical protein
MFKASPLFFRVFFSGDYLCAADVATTLPASAWHVLGFALAEISGFRTHKLEAIFVVVAHVKGMSGNIRDWADALVTRLRRVDAEQVLDLRRCH